MQRGLEAEVAAAVEMGPGIGLISATGVAPVLTEGAQTARTEAGTKAREGPAGELICTTTDLPL